MTKKRSKEVSQDKKNIKASFCSKCGRYLTDNYLKTGSNISKCPKCKSYVFNKRGMKTKLISQERYEELENKYKPQSQTSEKKELKGNDGWLGFFIFTLGVSVIVNIVLWIWYAIQAVSSGDQIVYAGFLITTILSFAMIGFGVYTIIAFLKHKPSAVTLAYMYLGITLFTNFMDIFVLFVRDSFLFSLSARSAVYCIIWILYLNGSQRVKNTYPIEERQTSTYEKVFFFLMLAFTIVLYLFAAIGSASNPPVNEGIPSTTIHTIPKLNYAPPTITYPKMYVPPPVPTYEPLTLPRLARPLEYSDGVIYFVLPLASPYEPVLNIDKQNINNTPYYYHEITNDNGLYILIIGWYDDQNSESSFGDWYESRTNMLREYYLTYTLIKQDDKTNINGFRVIEKDLKINSQVGSVMKVVVIFDTESKMNAAIQYVSPETNDAENQKYLAQIMDSVVFS